MATQLQYWESQIAEAIMLEFAKQKKPIMCMHDSLIVRSRDREFLEEQIAEFHESDPPDFTSLTPPSQADQRDAHF